MRALTAPERGFTLLEVLVAMALAGIGIAIAFAGISGATRLARKSHEHEIATRLAAAKLEEVLASPSFDLAPDPRTDRYAGVDYGYKIEVKPVEFRDIAPLEPARLPIVLDEVSIDVYWGPDGAQQRYRLVTYRVAPRNAPAAPAAAMGTAPAPGGS